ncbi:hypothetical protein GGQ86_000386 [Xanthobacter flavus]|uniref:Uncharacterized protein n=1 Tax=Xanthobacter flavus TaxID=281 RepID=A0A9W6CUP8_XANFL|nr:hypothetical protein [Xanthobacter flavus]MDR6331939.1 hypothetical protein [Xanthobacter flavus]GLI25627.1 hypothetical protein XFLAVUS301_53010 [Xanthobacter flavus]
MSEAFTVSGDLPTTLANTISDAIHAALSKGMEPDAACCVAVAIVADYARTAYGDGYLADLAGVLLTRAGAPLPEVAHG